MNRRLPDLFLSSLLNLVLVWIFLGSVLPASAANWNIHAQPARLVNGGPVLFQIKPAQKLQSLSGTWLGHHIAFSFDSTSKTWFALAGVSLETAPGTYALELTGETAAGKRAQEVSFRHKFAVTRAKYPKSQLSSALKASSQSPIPTKSKQIDEDQKIKKDYLNRVTPEREWSGNLTHRPMPRSPTCSAPARLQRQNLELASGSGFPRAKRNSRGRNERGNSAAGAAAIFRGQLRGARSWAGLLTIYMHLSQFKVKEGDQVKRGQQLGLSGGTGRATGPHLHVAVRWQGTISIRRG